MKRSTMADVLHDIRTGFACGANPTTGVLQFRMNNVSRDGSLDFSKTRRVPRDTKKLQEFMLAPGDILFNITNSTELVGKTAFIQSLPEPTVFSNHFFRLRPHGDKADGRYLSLWLQKLFAERVFEGMCRQWVGQATINRDQFLAIEIPLPSVTEQRRLAAILDQAEALRAQRRAAIAQLDSLGQAIFVEMFGDPITNPKRWPTTPLHELGSVVTGNTPSRANDSYYGQAIEWIKSDNINTPDYYLTRATEGLSDAGRKVGRIVPIGAVLITCIAGSPDCIGNAGFADREVAFNQQINAFVPQRINSHFVYQHFIVGKKLIQAASTNGMKGMVSKSRFEQIEVLDPPRELQQSFEARILAIQSLRRRHVDAMARLDELFASLQHRAFRGELTRRASTLEDLQKLEADAGLEALIFVAKRTAKHDLYVIGKTLYMADKHHLEQHGRLIYGETHEALPMGPVPKAAYDTVKFLRGEQLFSSFDEASARAAIRVEGNRLVPLRDADLGKLSADAVKSLEWAIRYMDGATFEQAKAATHDAAWQRTPPNGAIALEHIIELLPAQARQRHWGL